MISLRRSTTVFLLLLLAGVGVALYFNAPVSTTLLMVLGVYLLRGVGVVLGDYIQPAHNQPDYVRRGNHLTGAMKV